MLLEQVAPLGDEDLALLHLELFISTPELQRWMLWVCYHATVSLGNGSAVVCPQRWGIADNGFDQGNPRDNPSASLFLKVPRDPTKSLLVS